MTKREFISLLDSYLSGNASAEQEQMIINYYNSFDPVEWDAQLMGDLDQRELAVNTRIKEAIHQINNRKTTRLQPVRLLQTTWFRYAAAVILIISGVFAFLWSPLSRSSAPVVRATHPAAVQSDINPGGQKATLTLSNGNRIELADGKEILRDGGAEIRKSDGELVYERSGPNTVGYNTMSTPRGGQYKLRLDDGTQVWLNAASSITFPTAFTGNERKVSITGEVYFEVAKDKNKPFKVSATVTAGKGGFSESGEFEIEVLGTHFNVNTYADEAAPKTTLLEGSVKINSAIASRVLTPGQQAEIGNSRQIILNKNVDVEQVVAWKNGIFNFDEADLPAVMRQFCRWYDLEVQYKGAIPQREFQGKLGRDLQLSQVLKVLTQMQVKFSRNGRVIVIEES